MYGPSEPSLRKRISVFLARIGLDVDVRGALVIGVDDHFVHELHQLVVRGGRGLVRAPLAHGLAFLVHGGQQVADVPHVHRLGAVELVDRLLELALRGDAVDDARLGEHVGGDARAADALWIDAQHHQPLLRVVDRQPLVLLDVLALQVLQQLHRLDAVRLERLVGHAEELGQRRADRRDLDLELLGQHLLDVHRLLARLARGELELPGRQHRVGDQVVVLGLDQRRLLPLAEGDRQRLRQLGDAVLGERAERHARLVVDDLDDADQLLVLVVDDRRHQHLLGAVAGALVHLLQEAQVGVERLQLGVVVDVADVDRALGQRDEAGDRVLGHRQLQVLERVEAGLDLGDDRLLVVRDRVDRQAVGVEQHADVRAHLEHDLVDVGGGVDLVGDRLQLLLEGEPDVDVGLRPCLVAEYGTHRGPLGSNRTMLSPSRQTFNRHCPDFRAVFHIRAAAGGQNSKTWLFCSMRGWMRPEDSSISCMVSSVSPGFRWVT